MNWLPLSMLNVKCSYKHQETLIKDAFLISWTLPSVSLFPTGCGYTGDSFCLPFSGVFKRSGDLTIIVFVSIDKQADNVGAAITIKGNYKQDL